MPTGISKMRVYAKDGQRRSGRIAVARQISPRPEMDVAQKARLVELKERATTIGNDIVGGKALWSWAIFDFGGELPREGEDVAYWRGYFQVDPDQVARAGEIIHQVAEERTEQDLLTHFKVLIACVPVRSLVHELAGPPSMKTWPDDKYVGDFRAHEAGLPISAIYGMRQEDMLGVLASLFRQDAWRTEIEAERIARGHFDFRQGTNRFRDPNSGELSICLSHNKFPGHTNVFLKRLHAEGKNWREEVDGPTTKELEAAWRAGTIAELVNP